MRILIKGTPLATISYAPAPLTPHAPITQLTPEQFTDQFGCQYSEDLYSENEMYLPQLAQYESHHHVAQESITHRLRHPLEGLVVCKMAEPVGYGLFTQQYIPKGTIIGFLNGKMQNSTPELDEYTVPLKSGLSPATDVQALCSVSAAEQGGLMRFMQHLPSLPGSMPDKDIIAEIMTHFAASMHTDALYFSPAAHSKRSDYKIGENQFIKENASEDLATANVKIERVIYNNILLLVAVAECDIPAYDQLGPHYDPHFWKLKKEKPLYFNLSGKIITSPIQYKLDKEEKLMLQSAKNIYQIGVNAYTHKNFASAEVNILHAQTIFIQTQSYYCLDNATALSTLASIYREQNKIMLAVETLCLSIMVFENLKNPAPHTYHKLAGCLQLLPEVSPAFKSMATHYLMQGHYQIALTLFLNMLGKWAANNPVEQAICNYYVGSCYHYLGETEKAYSYDKAAKEISQCPPELLQIIEARAKVERKFTLT